MKVVAFSVALTLLLIGTSALAFEIQPLKSSEPIYIKANGLITGTDKITSSDNVTYTFIGDIYDEIIVERSDILVEGNMYTLQGSGDGEGFYLSEVRNVTIKNINVKDFRFGIYFSSSSLCIISGNNLGNNDYGVGLSDSDNNLLFGNNITNNNYGVYLWQCQNNNVSGNSITSNNWHGVGLSYYSTDNIVFGNNITNNNDGLCLRSSLNSIYQNNIAANKEYGVLIEASYNNNLSGNVIDDNKYNLFVYASWQLSEYIHSIDTSNLVNGKPVYYLVNQKNLVINTSTHSQIGYLALIDCANITVEGLTLANNGQGLLLAYTSNSIITNNYIVNNEYGVWLSWSSHNTISGNYMTSNNCGVYFDTGSYNTVSGNYMKKNKHGVWLSWSPCNVVSGNNITNNSCGILLYSCKGRGCCNNKFFHNNIINNTRQVRNTYCAGTIDRYPNSWDDGVEGNYWSNYTGVDSDRDGIGDFQHVIDSDNRDNYPLVGVFHSFNTSLDYRVNVCSNSTIESFQYFESNSTITMHVSEMIPGQTSGFCRISIPHALMNETYHVTVNGEEPHYANYTLYDDEENRWIYFSYQHSALKIVIIPESLNALVLLLFIIIPLIAVKVYKKQKVTHFKSN